MKIRESVVNLAEATTTVRIWRVVVAYVILAVGIVAGFWRLEALDSQQAADRIGTRTAVSCAFELALSQFPDAVIGDVAERIHTGLEAGGFPAVTLEQCLALTERS